MKELPISGPGTPGLEVTFGQLPCCPPSTVLLAWQPLLRHVQQARVQEGRIPSPLFTGARPGGREAAGSCRKTPVLARLACYRPVCRLLWMA
jgi:hypothetical protein